MFGEARLLQGVLPVRQWILDDKSGGKNMSPPNLFDLRGRVAAVTGGNGGIGRSIALGLAQAGAAIAVLARNEEKNQRVLGELKTLGGPALALRVDVMKFLIRDAPRGPAVGHAERGHRVELLLERGAPARGRARRDPTWRVDLVERGLLPRLSFGRGARYVDSETCDIRLFPPRSLTLKGVVMSRWLRQAPHHRRADVALALQPAQKPALFEVAEPSVPSRITEAPAHVGRAGRAGVVLIDFSNDRRGA